MNDGKASASATGCLTKEVGAVVTSDAQLADTHQIENAGNLGKTKSSEILLIYLIVR